MKVVGAHTVPIERQLLWDALHDPELLRRALPGCSRLDCTEPGRYVVTIRVGIPCVEGAYHGDLQVVERTAPSSLTLVASAAGEQGSGQGQVTLDLDESDSGTRVSYDVDAEVAGAISRVGQRLLTSAVERTVADHLDAVAGAHAHGTHRDDGVTPAAGTMVEVSPGDGADRAHTDPGGAVELASGQDTEQDRGFVAPLAVTGKQALATTAIGSALIGFLLGRRSRR